MMINSDANNLGIKRSNSDSSLDGLFGYTPDDVESKKEIEVKSNGVMDETIKTYEYYLGRELLFNFKMSLVLEPQEISTFIKLSEIYEDKKLYHIKTGIFVSELIEQSYLAGYNDFNFDINKKYGNFGIGIFGKKDRPLKINVNGDLGGGFCSCSRHVVANVNGNLGSRSAYDSKYFTAEINGDVGNGLGSLSNNLLLRIKGDVGDCFANRSKNIRAIIEGSTGMSVALNSHDYVVLVDKTSSYARGRFFGKNKMIKGKRARKTKWRKKILNELERRMKE
jgi:hypothetical protein